MPALLSLTLEAIKGALILAGGMSVAILTWMLLT